MLRKVSCPERVEIIGPVTDAYAEVLTFSALQFIADLTRRFRDQRDRLLHNRKERAVKLKTELPDFLGETRAIREGNWSIAPLPQDLLDRRVEITGPAGDRKMVINALNSGAQGFMADFEDANSPTWHNTVQGQINLRDAIRGTLTYMSPQGKWYKVNPDPAVLHVRPRGWHLDEKHVLVDGKPVPASLFDFGLYFYHNAKALVAKGSGPYFYLPKMESHLEARLWNDVFVYAQQVKGIEQGTIKATVLIETILAAFEMDEILYELREHSAGLNCGRWDYIFSYMKHLQNHRAILLPDRSLVTMTTPFMKAYTQLAIQTCHKRNAPCIGGMAAHIPSRKNPEATQRAFELVRADKEREAQAGHDGTWVAHPVLVQLAREVFDHWMPEPNQISRKQEEVTITQADLLRVPTGPITEDGLRTNIRVGIHYIAAWLSGSGAVAIDNLMEDAATAEISRAQVWQWLRHPDASLEDGRPITKELYQQLLQEEATRLREQLGSSHRLDMAIPLFSELVLSDEFTEFLTLPGYALLD